MNELVLSAFETSFLTTPFPSHLPCSYLSLAEVYNTSFTQLEIWSNYEKQGEQIIFVLIILRRNFSTLQLTLVVDANLIWDYLN